MKKLISLAALFCSLTAYAQDDGRIPFNGIVTDLTGSPIKGAKVYTINPSFYAKSDKQGRFGLTNVADNDTLHIIYKKTIYNIPVANRKSARIRLGDQVNTEEDEELVNLGYGFVKRREQFSSSKGITGEILVRTGRTNLLEALTGLVPGLTIHPKPSGGFTAQIRGISSVKGNTEPLYLLNGTEVINFDFLDLNEVKTVEVMKDGSMYGAKGANGVISVTTKY